MGYWQAKADLEFIRQFKGIAMSFMLAHAERADLIKAYGIQKAFSRITEDDEKALDKFKRTYIEYRQQFVRSIDRASRLLEKHNVPNILRLSPPPAIGGYVERINIFQAFLQELPCGAEVQPQRVIDIIHQTEAACEDQVRIERRHLCNPFYWMLESLTFVLRIPFLLIQTSGFHIEKFEEQLWGRVFKLMELLAILGLLVWLGASKTEIKSMVIKYLDNNHAAKSTDVKAEDKPVTKARTRTEPLR